MADTIRWGILGTGTIAHKFATGLTAAPGAELIAVGSRTQGAADEFASKYNIPHRHAGYEALARDSSVDVIYVATPHTFHAENTRLCLEAGKPVLCEKPFTLNTQQANAVIALARRKGLFLMEAMWTRFLPAIVRLRELVAAGTIGELRMMTADFGFRTQFNPEGRLFNPALGGGGLLDVGVYPVSLAFMLFGTPARITSTVHLGDTGVDEQAAWLFGYEGGQIAVMSSAIRTTTPHEAVISGTKGIIRIPDWWHADRLILQPAGQPDETLHIPFEGNGYNYEAIEVMNGLKAGKLESDVMSLDETRAVMSAMDTIRAQWGLKYPGE